MSLGTSRSARTVAYYVGSTALAAVFLFPVAVDAWSSIHGTQATGAGNGVGVDNYRRLFDYGEGFGALLRQQHDRLDADRRRHARGQPRSGGYAFARFPFRGRGRCCSSRRWRSSWCRTPRC